MEVQQVVEKTIEKYEDSYAFARSCPYLSNGQKQEAFQLLQEAKKLLQNPEEIVEFQRKYEMLAYWD